MFLQIRLFFAAFVLIPLIDYIWLGRIMSGFYLSEMGPLARTENGVIKPLILPAILVYIFLALGLVVFVESWVERWTQALGYGALLGLIIYGVYDLTNLACTAGYPVTLTVVDMAWGTFLCGLVSTLVFFLRERLS